jgi:hypothetical protein
MDLARGLPSALVEAMQVFGAAWADGPLLRAGAHVARGALSYLCNH